MKKMMTPVRGRDAGNRVERGDEARRFREVGENEKDICHALFIA